MEAAPAVFAVDEKVLVGDNQHEAYVARPVRAGDDTVLVRWESTGAREEVAVGDVKKIDLDAKRPRRKRRDASAAQTEASAPARREPPRKRRKKKADADNDESSSVDTTPSVAAIRTEIRTEYQREQEAARAAANDAEEDAGAEDPPSAREEIELHVKALQSGGADGREEAAVEALRKLADSDANCSVIARRLVGLLWGGSASGQYWAARALRTAIAEAGGIEELVALVANGAAGGQELAVAALGNLAHYDANKVAIVAAGGVEALSALLANGSDFGKEYAWRALEHLGPLAEYASRLQSENASLKRQLAGDDVVDLRDGDASPPAKKRNALRDAHDEQQSSTLNRVKQENVHVEGQRDRTDATAAAASAAAAKASAAAAKASAAAATAKDDAEEAQDTLGYQVRFTDALQTKIDELHALASQVDPVAADAIKSRPN